MKPFNATTLMASAVFFSFALLTACNHDETTPLKPIDKVVIDSIEDNFSEQSPFWKSYAGHWQFKNGELEQNSTTDDYPIILREDKPRSDTDIQLRFKPVSGEIDASGGIIFRAQDEDNYYLVRANALEDNFRLYTFTDGYRHQLASATVTPPALGKFHTMHVVAKGDHIQAYLDNKLALDFHDNTFKKGYTGLWTKADSVTVFDDFKVSELGK